MLHIHKMELGVLETNCYIVHNDHEAVVIDPGGNPEKIIDFLQKSKLELRVIVNTHLHFDHIQGNAGLAQATGALILASPHDAYLLETELGGGGMMGFPLTATFTFEPLDEGQYTWINAPCQVLATPGHSPGSLSLYFPDLGAVFVGDLLFYRSVGRTDFPGSSHEELLHSVKNKIFTLPQETAVYPGHGPQTTIAAEQLNNPFFSDFNI